MLLFLLMGENMAFRVVLIENEVTIKVKLNNLIVTKEGENLWIPLDDISMIVMDNLSSMLSAKAFVPVVGAGNRVNDMQSEAFTNGLL